MNSACVKIIKAFIRFRENGDIGYIVLFVIQKLKMDFIRRMNQMMFTKKCLEIIQALFLSKLPQTTGVVLYHKELEKGEL
jgi:hypothetical protein